MLISTKAIVFSAIKYSEADLIVSAFTEKAGIKSYLLRNILKAKKGKIKASYFQPLSQLEIIADHKNKGTLEYIKEVKIYRPYNTLHTNILKSGVVMFVSEILKSSIKEEEANEDLYAFLEHALNWLDGNSEIANFHIFFLLQLSGHLGFYPDASRMECPYFNIIEGNFQENSDSNYCLEGNYIEDFKRFFNSSFSEISTIKLNRERRLEVLNLLLSYYRFHIQGFQNPKSLAVLNQLFA